MNKRTYLWVAVIFIVLVIIALGIRGQGEGSLTDWLRSMHGR
jgi:hypothetical protein